MFILLTTLMLSAQAQPTPILVADQNAGRTLPQFVYQNHCELSPDGVLTGFNRAGIIGGKWQTETPIQKTFTADELFNIRTLIIQAALGTYTQARSPCDGPSTRMNATGPDNTFALVSLGSCGGFSQQNESDEAKKLEQLLKDNCNLKDF